MLRIRREYQRRPPIALEVSEPVPSPGDAGESRLIRLEEAAAFNDRALEELSAQLADLFRRVESLARRLAELERRIETTAHDRPMGGDDEAPNPVEPSESP
jgi:uncharacterized coiled-coil protein SlyX